MRGLRMTSTAVHGKDSVRAVASAAPVRMAASGRRGMNAAA
jgi:hypothetical protein